MPVVVEPTGAATAADAPPERIVLEAIAAQPLTQALAAFTSSTHLQLVYVSQLALGRNSKAVPPADGDDGLTHLLEGTGLDFKFLNDRTIKLFERPRAARAPAATLAPNRAQQRVRRGLARGGRGIGDETRRIFEHGTMSISVLSRRTSKRPEFRHRRHCRLDHGDRIRFQLAIWPGNPQQYRHSGISADKGDATTGIYVDDTPIQTPHTTFATRTR